MIPAIPAAVWDALNLEFTASGTRWVGEASSGFSVEDPSGGGYWTLESDWNEGTAMAHRVAYFERNTRGGFDRNVALTMSGDGDIFGGGAEDGAYNANMFGFTADTSLFLADWGLGPGHLFGSGGAFRPKHRRNA